MAGLLRTGSTVWQAARIGPLVAATALAAGAGAIITVRASRVIARAGFSWTSGGLPDDRAYAPLAMAGGTRMATLVIGRGSSRRVRGGRS